MHWSEDAYWTEALQRYHTARESGTRTITVDLDAVEHSVFDGDGPAYRTMDAMVSVLEHEGMDGCRGAPRVILALLMHLSELSSARKM